MEGIIGEEKLHSNIKKILKKLLDEKFTMEVQNKCCGCMRAGTISLNLGENSLVEK